MKKAVIIFIFSVGGIFAFGQSVGISEDGAAPDNSAILDVDVSSMANKKGILIPRMTTLERDAMPNLALGLLIFNTDCRVFQYWDNDDWIPFPTGAFNASFPQSVVASSSPEPVCQDGTLNLTGTATNALFWSWTGPDGFTSNVQNPVISNFPSAAEGTYYLTASNYCGSTAATPIVVTMDSIPPVPVAAAATDVTDISFTANWNASIGANAYYLDVATDINFNTILPSYNSLNVGNVISYSVTGLSNPNDYYYRVRVEGNNVCGLSDYSDTIKVSTPVCFPEGWTQKTDLTGSPRQGAIGFSIGTKGYIGTGSNNAYLKDFWEWDQATDTWTQKADFGGDPRANAVAFAIGTKGYVGTGANNSYLKDFWEFNSLTNTWTQKADFGGAERQGAVGFAVGTKGYIGTGSNNAYLKDFWEYDPGADSWTQKADFGGAERQGATGFGIASKGYIGTGSNNAYLKDFWEYDAGADSWTQKADFGGAERQGAASFSMGVKGFVGTGSNNTYLGDFWEYDSGTDVWTVKTVFGGAVRQKAVGFTIGSYGYIGTGSHNAFQNDLWEYCQSQ